MPALMGLTFWHAPVLQKDFWNMRFRKESRKGEWTGQLKGVKSRRGKEVKKPIPGLGEIHHASSGRRFFRVLLVLPWLLVWRGSP